MPRSTTTRMVRAGSLTDVEVGMIRNLLLRGELTNQKILGLINAVRRQEGREDVNGGRISDVKNSNPRYAGIAPASNEDTDAFLDKASAPPEGATASTDPLVPERLRHLFPANDAAKGTLAIAETDLIECKQSFGTQHLVSNCLRAIAAFANHRGGYIAFGVKDRTWEVTGIDGARFRTFDRRKFNQALLSRLSCAIDFDTATLDVEGKTIGVLYVFSSKDQTGHHHQHRRGWNRDWADLLPLPSREPTDRAGGTAGDRRGSNSRPVENDPDQASLEHSGERD